jgi:hypothetical protein
MRGTWQTTGGGGESGSVIALIAFIVLAIAGGVGHKALTGALHTVATAFEVIVWTVAGVVILAAAAGVAYVVLRIRTAVRAARERRAVPPPVITITPEGHGARYLPPSGTDRPAIDAPHSARSWPLPGWWAEIRPRIGGDDDEHRR